MSSKLYLNIEDSRKNKALSLDQWGFTSGLLSLLGSVIFWSDYLSLCFLVEKTLLSWVLYVLNKTIYLNMPREVPDTQLALIHSFNKYFEDLLCTRHCSKHGEYSSE